MNESYELTCMMCGTVVSQTSGSGLDLQAACERAARTNGQLRCGRCGGSLYVEPMDTYAASLDPRVQAALIEAESIKQAHRGARRAPTAAEGADIRDGVAGPGAA